jgi:hypothetical protein
MLSLRTLLPAAICAAALGLAAGPGRAGVDPEQLGLHWTWSANAGWIDAGAGGLPGVGLRVDGHRLAGWLWSANLGWINASCENLGTCAETDFGWQLLPDPEAPAFLRISGKAWSENAGWIVADCSATSSCDGIAYGLRVHRATGLVEGHAWAENLGWISASCTNADSCASVDFGLQLDPSSLPPADDDLFRSGFEG